MDLTLLLHNGKSFSDLDQKELNSLQQVASRREFRKGQVIFNEGDASSGFFLVITISGE